MLLLFVLVFFFLCYYWSGSCLCFLFLGFPFLIQLHVCKMFFAVSVSSMSVLQYACAVVSKYCNFHSAPYYWLAWYNVHVPLTSHIVWQNIWSLQTCVCKFICPLMKQLTERFLVYLPYSCQSTDIFMWI